MRVQTISSLRNPGHLMRAGMNMLTTQVNSLRDYCGVTTGHPLTDNYLLDQQQFHDLRYSPAPRSYLGRHQITTINEDDELMIESTNLLGTMDGTPYVGHTSSAVLSNASGIGRLDAADNSALSALENFERQPVHSMFDGANLLTRGQLSAGIGTFHGHMHEQHDDDDLIDEPERLAIYGEQRPAP
jgi:hypothetical protein